MLDDKENSTEVVTPTTGTEETSSQKPSAPADAKPASGTVPAFKKRKKRIKKSCWLCKWGFLHVDYKDVDFLKRYLKHNKIITHKFTGNCLKHQHQISTAIKRARIVALLPFVGE